LGLLEGGRKKINVIYGWGKMVIRCLVLDGRDSLRALISALLERHRQGQVR